MTNRIHEHLNPTDLTRLISIGRQLLRQSERIYVLRKDSAAALKAGTHVRVIGVGVDRVRGEPFYHVMPEKAEGNTLPVFCSMSDFE